MREEVPLTMHDAPRFDPIGEQAEMLSYLNANGYVVVRSVADEKQVERAKREFWEYMESCTSALQAKGKIAQPLRRDSVATWSGKQWLPNERTGILNQYGFNHSDFLWNTRLLPKVKAAFAAIWETEDLLVSFDAGNAFRPWKYNPGTLCFLLCEAESGLYIVMCLVGDRVLDKWRVVARRSERAEARSERSRVCARACDVLRRYGRYWRVLLNPSVA